MHWHDLTMNPEAIGRLYNAPPSLARSRLTEVTLHRDGPRMSVHAILADFPDNPPAKWAREGNNAVSIQLDLFDVADVEIGGWDTENLVDLSVTKGADGRVRVEASAGPSRLAATCSSLRVARVTGYVSVP